MSNGPACPWCHRPVWPTDFLCPACGLLLHTKKKEVENKPLLRRSTLVEALLSPRLPTRTERVPLPPPARHSHDDQATRRLTPLPESSVPRLRIGLDEVQPVLHEVEAYVASFIDGEHTLTQLAQATSLTEAETTAVVSRLSELRMVELEQPPAPPAPARRKERAPPQRGARAERPPASNPPAARNEARSLYDDEPPTLLEIEVPPPLGEDLPTVQEARPPLQPVEETTELALPAVPLPIITRAPVQRHIPAALRPPPRGPPVQPASTAPLPAPAPAPVPVAPPARAPRPPAPDTAARPRQAQEVLERVIRLERSGQVGEAIDLLAETIAQVREPSALYNKLALILLHQRQDYARATQLLEQALRVAPDNAVCRRNLQLVRAMEAEHRKGQQELVRAKLAKLRPSPSRQ